MACRVAQVDDLLKIDPQVTRHLFLEKMTRIFFAMREIDQEDVDDEIMRQFLAAMDGISNVLYRIEKSGENGKAGKTGAREFC